MTARDVYQAISSACIVATNGSASGNGTLTSPITLAALAALDVWPGATIYLRGGTYTGTFLTTWRGNVNGEITIKAYPGETVVIDGTIDIRGPHQTWDGFEVLNSAWTTRTSTQGGSAATDLVPREGYIVNAADTTIQNCRIHDCRQGILASADGLIVRNCHFYNNGWWAPDRGHGHSIYWNNVTTPSLVERCVFVHDYDDWGIHAYSAASLTVSNITVRDCVHIGKISMIWTAGLMDNISYVGNETWRAKVDIGQSGSDHFGITITDNYIVGASPWNPFTPKRLKSTVVRRNTLVSDGGYCVDYTTPNTDPPLSIDWDANAYYQSSGTFINDNGTPRTLAAWQAARGLDAASTYTAALPTANRIRTITRANDSLVVVYNWENLASVAAPVAGTYINALNPAESVTLAQGAALPMSGWTVAIPNGDTVAQYGSTFPGFGCFVVTP